MQPRIKFRLGGAGVLTVGSMNVTAMHCVSLAEPRAKVVEYRQPRQRHSHSSSR